MYLTNGDIQMLDGSIKIMGQMYAVLRELAISEARKEPDEETKKRYARKDKKDTRRVDIVAEEAISFGPNFLKGHDGLFKQAYDQAGVIITEERGKIGSDRIEHNTPVIISDPTDKSSYLEELMESHGGSCQTVGELFDHECKELGADRARVEACNSSVTLLKDNMIKYSIVLNFFTGEIVVAFEKGVFCGDIARTERIDDLQETVQFKTEETLNMLCYCEGVKYENNRREPIFVFFR